MRTFASLLALGLIASAVACATPDGSDDASDESAATNGWVTSEVTERLRVSNPRDEGTLWAVTNGNLLSGDYLLQMPRAEWWGKASIPAPKRCADAAHCDADFQLATCSSTADCASCAPLAAAGGEKLCLGHSDSVLDEIYGVMTRAQSTLDITSLTSPRGKYLATMRNALTALDKSGARVQVRFLFGSFPDNEPDLMAIAKDLTRDVRGRALSVSIGAHRRSPTSWNHSKIIAADGREMITGGMNLWDSHYLEADPVHDVSLHLRGPVTVTAQTYVNELWKVACGNGKVVGVNSTTCPKPFQMAASSSAPVGDVRMIPIGRLGSAFDNPSDKALPAMMDMAKNGGQIRIAQQDLGSYRFAGGGTFPNDVYDAFTRAARRGVDVTVILSNDNAYGGGGHTPADAYFNGWSLKELWRGLVDRANQQWPGNEANLCKHVHFARMRAAASATWASGMPFANHSKVVIVDDQAHYVGSQNLYEANLAEFGVIIDNQPATQAFLRDYWNHLSELSVPTGTYHDPSCGP